MKGQRISGELAAALVSLLVGNEKEEKERYREKVPVTPVVEGAIKRVNEGFDRIKKEIDDFTEAKTKEKDQVLKEFFQVFWEQYPQNRHRHYEIFRDKRDGTHGVAWAEEECEGCKAGEAGHEDGVV